MAAWLAYPSALGGGLARSGAQVAAPRAQAYAAMERRLHAVYRAEDLSFLRTDLLEMDGEVEHYRRRAATCSLEWAATPLSVREQRSEFKKKRLLGRLWVLHS